uniref:Uncharacterized protein n=1 Tax=Tanacetum cinerariifolium TaxID=118510 RepID=A0A6L2NIZ8_TANCI|nr:hypothetical protein [Tanacetum cinerariifolium]
MEEYIRLEEEKAHRHGKVYNWETATYGRIWYEDDIHDLRSVETEFPTIAFNDTLTSKVALSYEPTGLEYTGADIADFEERLGNIYGRGIHRVQVFDFRGLTAEELSVLDLDTVGELQFQLGRAMCHMSRREFILGMGLHTVKEIESAGFGAYWADSGRQIPDKEDISAYWRGISSEGDFLGTTPSYTVIEDPMLRLCHRLIKCSITRRSQAPKKFVARLAEHFRLLTEERLQGLTVIVRDLLVIEMAKLVRLQICKELVDTWAWVASRPSRQPDALAGALEVTEGAPDVDEGPQAVPVPVQGDVLDVMSCDFSWFTTWTVSSLSLMMDRVGVSSFNTAYSLYDTTYLAY